jgi:hypothetical protein
MQVSSSQSDFFGPLPYRVKDLGKLFQAEFPQAAQPEYFSIAASSYVQAIATYLVGQPNRAMYTLAHVTALVQYHDYKQVLALLSADQTSEPLVRHFNKALEQGAARQAEFAIQHVKTCFAHLDPGHEVNQLIQNLMKNAATTTSALVN